MGYAISERAPGAVSASRNKEEAARSAFAKELLFFIPHLRAFAKGLCGDHRADDLVQETLTKALTFQNQYTPGTNMRAWLFTILRNGFYTEIRKTRLEVEDVGGWHADHVPQAACQDDAFSLTEFNSALSKLNADQREALMLVGASGFSYEEAAQICNVAVGTIKSRVSRARESLTKLLPELGYDSNPR